jgi:hypothetical protein
MEELNELLGHLCGYFTEANVRMVTTYGTFLAVLWTLIKTRWNNQKITIIAVNAQTGDCLEVAKLPRFQVTRGEVLGIMRLQAGGEQLNTSCFKWNDKIPKKARFSFPSDSYALLTGKAKAPRNA